MALVEETAAYLDGPGRQESKKLERTAALAYATESMRLTTRLMQLASWLLLHRAVNEGEMSLAQANKEKAKVKLSAGEHDRRAEHQAAAGAAARADPALAAAAGARCGGSMPPSTRRCRTTARSREPGRAAARPAQGRLRAHGLSVSARSSVDREAAEAPIERPDWPAIARRRMRRYFLRPRPAKLLLEARQPAAAVEQLLLAAGPGRVRLRVDVEAQRSPPCPRWCGW